MPSEMEQAGADALELNIYYIPVDADASSDEIEKLYIDLVAEVRRTVPIPVAVKLGPYFSSLANMAQRLDAAGADGLVLFNRFYQPDFDLEALEVVPNLILSNCSELLLRLHWIAVLYGNIQADMAITGGVHTATDVVKVHDGRRQSRHDDFRSAEERHQLPASAARICSILAGRARVRLHPQMQGSMSRKTVPQPQGVRARQLHEGALQLRHEIDVPHE